jgi:signal transduction histidine kinase/ActR/RegA family two-component response regulator
MRSLRWWRMRFGRKQNSNDERAGEVARLAQLPGTDKADLVRCAVQSLLSSADVDRVGVWIDEGDMDPRSARGLPIFRGVVSERDGDGTPAEWGRLSLDGLPSLEPLTGGRVVDQTLDGTTDELMLGTLLELQRAVWAPVGSRGHLRGVLLAGTRRKHGALPLAHMEAISAELSLAIELEEERRVARQRQADLNAMRRLLTDLVASGPVDSLFTRLVDGCTETAPGGDGLGAVFAMLRTRTGSDVHYDRFSHDADLPTSGRSPFASKHNAHRRVSPAWQSGDAAWLHAMDSSPLTNIWQRASAARDTLVITSGSGLPWPRVDVARIVAIPLLASREPLGTLVAGFRSGPTTHGAVERLELRGELAATALSQRQCVAALSLERKRQRAILESDAAAKILVEPDGRLGGFSHGALDMLSHGAAKTDAAERSDPSHQRRFSDLFQAPDCPKVEMWLQQVQAPPQHIGSHDEPPEFRLRSGAKVRLRPIPLCDTPGAPLAAITLEALEQAPASQQPHRSETQLHHVIEWLEEGVVLFNSQHEIQAMNSRFSQIIGFAPEEALHITTLSGLISRMADQAAEPEKFANRWRELARGADSGVRDEIQLLRPVPRVVERASRPILGADGERLGRVEIYRDLTAQRVFQSKLLQTEKLAALGQMVTGVAHELSNPLTSILGYAQRLFLRNDADGQSDEARQIFQEAERAGTILRQLLMTARESRPDRRTISLNQVVTRTMELQKFNLAAEKIAIELALDSSLPGVLGDAGQLQQVLMNLIGNARQAIDQRGKGGKIRIATHHDAGQVRMEISDDGPGIPAAIASRIFDPFFTTKPAGIGTGLGLAVVLGIVREHGGQVKVTSPPGRGATFVLEFAAAAASHQSAHPSVHPSPQQTPLTHTSSQQASQPTSIAAAAIGSGLPHRDAIASRRASARPPLPAAHADAPLASWAGARVLVVEDEPTVARLIRDVLEDEGLLVEALLSGREALERSAEEDYDLVICDMKMPELDGEHFYRSLTASGNPLSRRFLFVTGDVVAAHTHDFLERNQLPHVAKPFRVEELTEKVRRVLSLVKPARLSLTAPEIIQAARK